MLVSVGRGPLVQGLGLEEIGVQLDPRKGIAADEHRRTTVPHIYAVGDCAGYWQLAHTAFREGEVAAENAMGHEAVMGDRAVPAADLHRSGDRGRRPDRGGGARAVRRRRRHRDVPLGRERPRRDAERDGRLGQVDPRDPLRRAARARHRRHRTPTDLIEAGVVALDAEATVETVADGMAPHPTLSEAIKEAGLVALGRAIHLPPKRKAAATA